MVGLTPSTAAEINNNVGVIIRRFVDDRESVHHLAASLASIDLQAEPYLMSEADETLIKSTVTDLDAFLQTLAMTNISQLAGMW
jgi:hypothetical protein